jgi:hypothetical protein
MDTRKLKFKALDYKGPIGAHVIDNHGRVIGSLNWVNDAEELVSRWNAYPDLVAALDDLMYELKARDEDYDMREPYGRADRLLKSIDADLGDKNE